MTETIWKCDQLRAGQLYNRMMFDTQAEAEQFACSCCTNASTVPWLILKSS